VIRSGCKVVTTCSPENFELVKAFGAAEAFDYHDPRCGEKVCCRCAAHFLHMLTGQQIREYTRNELKHALDCISEGSSPRICCDAISTQGGSISYLLPVQHSREDVANKLTLAYTVMGESFMYGATPYKASAEDFEFGKMYVPTEVPFLLVRAS
jgi:NADPH:quinone reductase-like Zn-dependent oxidoreductase